MGATGKDFTALIVFYIDTLFLLFPALYNYKMNISLQDCLKIIFHDHIDRSISRILLSSYKDKPFHIWYLNYV